MAEAKIIISIPEGKLRDYIDGTIRPDTPEEYVRQTVEKRLINEHKYLKNQVKIEYGVQMGAGKKRADIVIFQEDSTEEERKDQHNIQIIIECKKEAVKPTDKNNGVEQPKTYMAACNNCEWEMWTNGLHKTVYRKVKNDNNQTVFKEYNDIPSADGTTDEHESEPTNATGTEISFTTIPPRQELGYFHVHYKGEENYIVLNGSGYYHVDNDCFPIKEGSVIKVAPEGVRSLCNTSDEEMVYMCIQSTKDALGKHSTNDGKRLKHDSN